MKMGEIFELPTDSSMFGPVGLRSSEAAAHAVNCHDDLVAACEEALQEMINTVAPRPSFTDAVDMLDAAIAKARGAI